MKVIFEIETTGTAEELEAQIQMLAKFNGWQEKVQKLTEDNQPMVEEDGSPIMIDNPTTAESVVQDMLGNFLKDRLRQAYTRQAQSDAISTANDLVSAELEKYTSTLTIE